MHSELSWLPSLKKCPVSKLGSIRKKNALVLRTINDNCTCCSTPQVSQCLRRSFNSIWLYYSISDIVELGLLSTVFLGVYCKHGASDSAAFPGSRPSGARPVWSSFNEGSDKGEDERAVMRLIPWLEPALGLLLLVTLATDPLSNLVTHGMCAM